jgi:predicted MFS family arabinose efflux permease
VAGTIFAHAGSGWVFVLAVAGAGVLFEAVRRHPPRPHPPSRLPAERLWGGMLSALRFARHSDTVLAQLVRTMAYSATGSALWELLPLIGQRQLGLGATGFGFLMGCLGTGAVLAGPVIGRLRLRLGLERLVGAGCVVFALVMAVAALSQSRALVYAALVAGGAAWMSVMSTYNTATQTSVPPWVRARATALHTAGFASWAGASGSCGTTSARSLTLGASTPWKRIRCSRGLGTSAASRCMNSSGDITRWVVPSRQAVLSLSTTCPAALVCTRSLASAGRVM